MALLGPVFQNDFNHVDNDEVVTFQPNSA